jgi:hypothetical protein
MLAENGRGSKRFTVAGPADAAGRDSRRLLPDLEPDGTRRAPRRYTLARRYLGEVGNGRSRVEDVRCRTESWYGLARLRINKTHELLTDGAPSADGENTRGTAAGIQLVAAHLRAAHVGDGAIRLEVGCLADAAPVLAGRSSGRDAGECVLRGQCCAMVGTWQSYSEQRRPEGRRGRG